MDWTAEEGRGPSSAEKALRQPSDGLHAAAITPFLNKTYDMVDDSATDLIVSWGSRSNTFIVWNVPEFGRALLPKYFKHNNFSSFVRQLNTYGFRKVDPDRWEFANEDFLRGERHLLKNIHRRKPTPHGGVVPGPSQPPSSALGPVVEVGKFGLESTIEQLQRDKNVLMMELVRLRQQQQGTERELAVMAQRLQITDQRQQQMMSFLAKAMQNPSFLAQLVQQQTENSKRLANERKRRRLPLQEEDDPAAVSEGQIVKFQRNLSNDSARAVLLQLFDDTDRSMDEDGGSLDDLLREMGSTTTGDSGAVMPSRHSHVTVTEMPPRSNGTHTPLGVDDDPPRVHHLSPSSDAADDVQNLSPAVTPSSAVDSGLMANGGSERGDDFGNDAAAAQLESVDHSRADEGAEPRVNDQFWEQFLGGSSESSDVGSDKVRHPDAGHSFREGESEDTGTSVQMVGSRRSVDQLAEQMGQLTPGLQT